MNDSLFFLIFSGAILVFSVVSICVAPIINGFLGEDWGHQNCQIISDDYRYIKGNYQNELKVDLPFKEYNIKASANDGILSEKDFSPIKRKSNMCIRNKAMHSLEYVSIIFDIGFSLLLTILGLLHYLEIGNNFMDKTGLIGIIMGAIGFIITFVYLMFSCYIFNNDNNGIEKLFSNGAILKHSGQRFIPPYKIEKIYDKPEIKYATYSELGQKQYNYNYEIQKFQNSSEKYKECLDETEKSGCDFIWSSNNENPNETINKYLYDRWITTIIISAFIIIFCVGIIVFGFLLLRSKNLEGNHTPIPMNSENVANKKE